MSDDPSREHDDVELAIPGRTRPLAVMIGCFLLGGAGAALYAMRAQELLDEPPPPPEELDSEDRPFTAYLSQPDDGSSGQRHRGEEGRMGRPTPKNKSGLYAMKGPRVFESAGDPTAIPDDRRRGEGYTAVAEQPFTAITDDARSTFAIDVDTASYSNIRRMVAEHASPPPEAVRIEEMINYFDYAYPDPQGDTPFGVAVEVGPCPWNPANRLVHVGLQGRRLAASASPPRNLVFLVDVSGSMESPDKLPLLQRSLTLLIDQLRPEDRVGIVVYAGASGIVLDSTPGDRHAQIREALAELRSGGGTNGGAGIELAYRVAQRGFVPGGVNRVVLATDGDFNLGLDSEPELHRLIAAKRESGVFLSVLGFGTGNLQDGTMELLADEGNGNYGYIDSLAEARKLLVEEVGGTLVTIAKDVKIQVELDPRQVASWRLIGYDNRRLAHQDFADDTKDAGEIGAGHSVTALYEIVPAAVRDDGELMRIALRYKQPEGERSVLTSVTAWDRDVALADTSDDFRFAAAVAEAGLLLRNSAHRADASWAQVVTLAEASRGDDRGCWRAGFVALAVEAARTAGVTVDVPSTACES
jgi:Ca-activated chloride channel homolog